MLFDFGYYIMCTNESDILSEAAKVKKPALMHFSPKYKDSLQLLIEEATKAFGGEAICRHFQQFRQSSCQRQSF